MRDKGGEERFVEFMAASQRDLRRVAYVLSGDWQLSEDAVQTALYRMYLGWSRIERGGAAWSYARRAVINAVISQKRRGWRVETFVSDLPEHATDEDTASIDERLLLRQAMGSLPVRQRAVVVLRYVEDLDIPETAQILRCPPSTVTTWTARALASLRKFLMANGVVRGTSAKEAT